MKTLSIILILAITLGFGSIAFGQTVMIVNTDNSVSSITKSQVTNIFLGSSSKWNNGLKAMPVDQAKTTKAGQDFLAKIVGMSESEYKNLWVEKMLSGEAEPPPVKNSDAEVISFVKENVGAVGFIDASSSDSGVKVLKIDGKTSW